MTGGREGRNEGGGGIGKRDRSYCHPFHLWFDDVRYEPYGIYYTIDLCFPDTNTNKSKTNTTIMTNK